MTAAELETLARKLYDACPTPKPTWEQLGDTTRGLWVERARKAAHGAQQAPQAPASAPARPAWW
jgi:hypothetical protein